MFADQAALWRKRYQYRRALIYRKLLKSILALPEVRFDTSAIAPIDPSLLIYDDICLPPYHGPDDHDDIAPLLALVQRIQVKLVIEFGTAQGNTVANICRFSAANVITVNALPEQISGQATTFTLTRDNIGSVYRHWGYSDRVVQIYENTLSINLSGYVQTDSVDLAIVDACHDTDYVINDFRKLVPFIRKGGIILLHDTHPSMQRHLVGSYMGCMKLRMAGFNICHLENTWWGIWIKGGLECSGLSPVLAYKAVLPIWNHMRRLN